MTESSFTGRGARRRTRASVIFAERIARLLITIGGAGTIIAVSLIFFFLAWVVTPLFRGAKLEPARAIATLAEADSTMGAAEIVELGVGPFGLTSWTIDAGGRFETRSLVDGALLESVELVPEGLGAMSAFALTPERDRVALGLESGHVLVGEIAARQSFLSDAEEAELSSALQSLAKGEALALDGGVVLRTPTGQLRRIEIECVLDDPVKPAGDAAIRLIDLSVSPSGLVFASYSADGSLNLSQLSQRYNMLEDREITTVVAASLPFENPTTVGPPAFLCLDDLGVRVFMAWSDGTAQQYDVNAEFTGGDLAHTLDMAPDADTELVALQPILGKNTLVSAVRGASGDELDAWFCARVGGEGAMLLQHTHDLPLTKGTRVTVLRPSPRSRVLGVGTEAGRIELVQVTTEALLGRTSESLDAPLRALAISDRQDAIVGIAGDRLARIDVDLGYAEATLASIALPVWYEGYSEPTHAWQSTSASNDFEPKLGLTPLVFGTLKATFYSMIFGGPLALLAAIFTSEYLKGATRATIKSVLELMASLPSVVLGFLAAMIIAPMVQEWLPGVLAAFVALPLTLLVGAHVWQLLPRERALRWSGWQRFLCICVALILALPVAGILGPLIEQLVFAGDVEAWLGGRVGGGTSGWLFLFLPLSVFAVTMLFGRVVQPRLRGYLGGLGARKQGGVELGKLLVGLALTLLLAIGLSLLFGRGIGWDPRGSFIGAYDQRNALVVGFVMGFAVIPIIYTLAEDALASVPAHLREASLGAGATPWQTAVRVIVPTAMSGLFSALMIGLGRAVGETMIVLMATGGTAIMDWNAFNGFRTLSANIATELPEAVKGSAHYRVLFLAGFVLFLMTFVLNTLAEIVRQRFRKRAFQL